VHATDPVFWSWKVARTWPPPPCQKIPPPESWIVMVRSEALQGPGMEIGVGVGVGVGVGARVEVGDGVGAPGVGVTFPIVGVEPEPPQPITAPARAIAARQSGARRRRTCPGHLALSEPMKPSMTILLIVG
jgi:hypothetical protein